MNDKQQLAAMGEHLAEQQQPMCLQKRVEQLEALLREARGMMDNQPRGFSGMMRRIDEALDGATVTKPAVPEGWQLVPVELTKWMREAFHDANDEFESGNSWMLDSPDHQWAAMLAAAPKPGDVDA